MLFAPPIDDDLDDCEYLGCPDDDWMGYDYEDWMGSGSVFDESDLERLETEMFEAMMNEAIKNNLDALDDYEFPDGFSVSKKDDLTKAFELIWDTFRNNVAVELAKYYKGQRHFVDVAGDGFGKTYNLGAATDIDMDRIYDEMNEGGQNHLGNSYDYPDIDERDPKQRAIFISSVLFHEYIHGAFHVFVTDEREGEAWAAQLWYIKHAGGHEYLEKYAPEYAMKTEYLAGMKRFEEVLGNLDRSPRLTSNGELKRLFD